VSERYELIRREEGNCPVASMCKLVGVSKSGYYDWLGRPDSATKVRRRKLTLMVESEFNASDMTYGYRRVTAALHRKGVTVSADTVRSIMREKELRAAQPRRKVRTTVPADDIDTRPDLVGRDFTARTPGLKWVGDITYIRTWVGFVYLATVLDCCTKKVIGYAMADNMRTDLVCDAIDMAVRRCPHQKNVTIFHSDRGSQYTSQQFARHLEHHKIRPSVGRTGVCWDNAWAESFNATLKNERVHRMVYPTREKAINDVASWIELTYNHTRLHSTLGYRTPNEVEHELRSRKHAA
jgi:integrase, catalytic region